ncbi:hypothetical protein [Defluviimonas sp. SAOS-178_SWC]|uniref:hypothetical protein n=1 Tax=Defluviimonas sp. SAOS-178_SWC TaxID=3121287 RepID=UPI003221505A
MPTAIPKLTDRSAAPGRAGLFLGAADLIQEIAEDPARTRDRALILIVAGFVAVAGTLASEWLIPALAALRIGGGA